MTTGPTSSYGCGDESCRSCYHPADWAVVDRDDGSVVDRWFDGDAARYAVRYGGYGEPMDYEVVYLPDPNPMGDDAP